MREREKIPRLAESIPTFDLRQLFVRSETAAPDSAMLWPLEGCELDLSKGDDGWVFQP